MKHQRAPSDFCPIPGPVWKSNNFVIFQPISTLLMLMELIMVHGDFKSKHGMLLGVQPHEKNAFQSSGRFSQSNNQAGGLMVKWSSQMFNLSEKLHFITQNWAWLFDWHNHSLYKIHFLTTLDFKRKHPIRFRNDERLFFLSMETNKDEIDWKMIKSCDFWICPEHGSKIALSGIRHLSSYQNHRVYRIRTGWLASRVTFNVYTPVYAVPVCVFCATLYRDGTLSVWHFWLPKILTFVEFSVVLWKNFLFFLAEGLF